MRSADAGLPMNFGTVDLMCDRTSPILLPVGVIN